MGVDATVYLAKQSLPVEVNALDPRTDPITGQCYFEETNAENQFSPEVFVAVHRRIGNAQMVANLRDEVREALGTTQNLLYERCLKSGTHSGDVIEICLIDQLEREIIEARKVERASPLLRNFLSAMTELIEFARREGNPIVFA